MMMKLSSNVIHALNGRTLVTAESCTGGAIGAALTAVPGSSAVYKGGIISYTNAVKMNQLGVQKETLDQLGAVSAEVAQQMAKGAKERLFSDIAISVTGLAGPTGDDFGNHVGTVYIGYADDQCVLAKKFHFCGDRDAVRQQAVVAALALVLERNEIEV